MALDGSTPQNDTLKKQNPDITVQSSLNTKKKKSGGYYVHICTNKADIRRLKRKDTRLTVTHLNPLN